MNVKLNNNNLNEFRTNELNLKKSIQKFYLRTSDIQSLLTFRKLKNKLFKDKKDTKL